MVWRIVYLKEAKEDLKELDRSQQKRVLKAIEKVSKNPLPFSEGGYGKPLGNRGTSKLTGFLKIKLNKPGIRVVYGLIRDEKTMQIVVISVRDDERAYRMAQERIKKNHLDLD